MLSLHHLGSILVCSRIFLRLVSKVKPWRRVRAARYEPPASAE